MHTSVLSSYDLRELQEMMVHLVSLEHLVTLVIPVEMVPLELLAQGEKRVIQEKEDPLVILESLVCLEPEERWEPLELMEEMESKDHRDHQVRISPELELSCTILKLNSLKVI